MKDIKKYIPAIAAVLLVLVGNGISIYQKKRTPEQYKTYYIDTFETSTHIIIS